MHRDGFHLKVVIGKRHRDRDVNRTLNTYSTEVRIIRDNNSDNNNSHTHYTYALQEFRSFLVANHLKHIVIKAEKNEECLNKIETIHLMQVSANLLIARHGMKPNLVQRKSFAATITDLFPQLDVQSVLKKLNQRIKNVGRRPKVQETHVRAINKQIDDYDNLDRPAESVSDYDDMVTAHNIQIPTKNSNTVSVNQPNVSNDVSKTDQTNATSDDEHFEEYEFLVE